MIRPNTSEIQQDMSQTLAEFAMLCAIIPKETLGSAAGVSWASFFNTILTTSPRTLRRFVMRLEILRLLGKISRKIYIYIYIQTTEGTNINPL